MLQKEIALVRAASNDRWALVNSPSRSQASRDSASLAPEDSSEAADGDLIGSVPRKKRRYRRHPKVGNFYLMISPTKAPRGAPKFSFELTYFDE